MRFIVVALFIGVVVHPLIGIALFMLVAIPSLRTARATYLQGRAPPASAEFDAYFARWQGR